MIDEMLVAVTVAFVLFAIALVYRAVVGPTMQDRVIAVNAIGTNTVVILALVAVVADEQMFLDVALVYALLNFLLSIAISKFTVERGGVI
jgi:multicomponent Na+:H+ antiporter subunit F